MKNIGVIVQARMGSSRLPGKVLRNIAGKPILQYLLERIERLKTTNNIVVATSTDNSDDIIAAFCKKRKINVYRGALSDVAGRFNGVLTEYAFEAFVRVNGDSPLIDPDLIDKAIMIYLGGKYDIVTNVLKRSYPKGESVEIVRADIFKDAYASMVEAADLEHVTRFFYKKRDEYNILNFQYREDLSAIQLSIDTPDDLDMFKDMIKHMDKPHCEYSLDEILNLYQDIQERTCEKKD